MKLRFGIRATIYRVWGRAKLWCARARRGMSEADCAWLQTNASERMDATFPWFDPRRRAFHLARYEFAARWAPGAVVLDCACGTGYGSERLARRGAARVVGLDLARDALAYARRYHRPKPAAFLRGDAARLPFAPETFDLIASFETIEHVPDDEALLRGFARALKPGGRAVVSTPNEWPLENCPHHVRSYTHGQFLDVLGRHFGCIELFNQNSGSPHPFNRGQAAGIVPTDSSNRARAECYIAVCREPRTG
ncbi:MAG: class I SAM-dependent methyltransferase [Planctomycetota bacterium]|nr:class I SAM-dependent methyltransferase [Planctomycetota bacterium]